MHPVRLFIRALEVAFSLPLLIVRAVSLGGGLSVKIGPLRYVVLAALGYTAFALALVYVVAPLRGIIGQYTSGSKLRYDSRALARDRRLRQRPARFVGTFDPRLDSRQRRQLHRQADRDRRLHRQPRPQIDPRAAKCRTWYWQCLVYHEDRYLGGLLNPYGIDLYGVLKIPYTIDRSARSR